MCVVQATWIIFPGVAHTKTVREAWAKFGIKVWPGAGVVGDWKLILEFTGKTLDDKGGTRELT